MARKLCKVTSKPVARTAGKALANPRTSKLTKKLAGSALSQRQGKR